MTPLFFPCVFCTDPVYHGESGFVLIDGSVTHRECLFRSTFGGPEHVLGICSCHHRPEVVIVGEIPPLEENMTYRQEARWVWKVVVGDG